MKLHQPLERDQEGRVALCIGIFLTRSYKACSNPGGDVVLASAIVVIAIAKVATKLNWLAGILSVKQIAVGLLDCLDLVAGSRLFAR